MTRQFVQGFFDLCTGCRICELACSSALLDTYKPRFAAIEIRMQTDGLAAIPSVCIQCEKPACMKSCPRAGAIVRDEATGIVRVVDEECTGCGVCVGACPIGAIKIEPASLKAIKCDLCDGDPACVKFCPTDALALTKI